MTWNAAFRPRNRLVFRMPPGWRQLHARDEFFFLIVVEPILSGLEACSHGVTGRSRVTGGMLAGRAVAAADMPALRTTA